MENQNFLNIFRDDIDGVFGMYYNQKDRRGQICGAGVPGRKWWKQKRFLEV